MRQGWIENNVMNIKNLDLKAWNREVFPSFLICVTALQTRRLRRITKHVFAGYIIKTCIY